MVGGSPWQADLLGPLDSNDWGPARLRLWQAANLRTTGITERGIQVLQLFLSDGTIYVPKRQKRDHGDPESERRWEPGEIASLKNPVQVRDFAAWCIGRLIGVHREPQKEWRAEDWDKYHEIVLDALRKRDGKNNPFSPSS